MLSPLSHGPLDALVYDAARANVGRTSPQLAPAGVRAALGALFRRRGDAAEATPAEPAVPDAPALPDAFEVRVRTQRANAHAAFRSVQGAPEAALDAALAVLEAEWRAAREASLRYADALKHVRLYSFDDASRRQAWLALEGADEATRGRPCSCSEGRGARGHA